MLRPLGTSHWSRTPFCYETRGQMQAGVEPHRGLRPTTSPLEGNAPLASQSQIQDNSAVTPTRGICSVIPSLQPRMLMGWLQDDVQRLAPQIYVYLSAASKAKQARRRRTTPLGGLRRLTLWLDPPWRGQGVRRSSRLPVGLSSCTLTWLIF